MSTSTSSKRKKKRTAGKPKWLPGPIYTFMNPRGISNSEFVFRTLWVLGVFIIAWPLLFAPGMTGDEFIGITYPSAIGWRIGLITLFMVVGAVVDLIVYRGRKASTLFLPFVLLFVLTILMFTVSGPFIQFIGGTGGAVGLWAFKIGGVLAILMNGWLVWRIWGVGEGDAQVKHQTNAVERLEGVFAAAKAASVAADRRLTDQRAVEARAKRTLDDAESAQEKATKALPKAQEKFDVAHKAGLDLKDQAVKDAKDTLKLEQGILDNFDNNKSNQALKLSDRAKYDRKRQKLEDKVNVADTGLKRAKVNLKRAKTIAEKTPEGRKLTRAKKALEVAQTAFTEAQKAHTGAQAATKTAEATFEGAKKFKENREKELESARQGLASNKARAATNLAAWWFGTVMLLLGTWVLYSSWYGWVLVEIVG